jgi:membrane associated rhomboid family serine protease
LLLNLTSPNTLFYLQVAPPRGAYSIIFISILFYGATAYFSNSMLAFTTKALIQSGALYNVAFFNGHWYTLFTALFVHGGPMHLFLNLLILYLWAINIEPLIGTWRLLLVFFTSGVVAFVVSLLVRHNSWVIMYGASSGVFGILGCMLSVFYLLRRPLVHYHLFSLQTLLFIAVSLLGSKDSNVDSVGHIAGFFSGLLLGVAFMRIHKRFHTLRQRMQAFAVVTGFLMTTAMAVVYNSRQNAVGFLLLYQQSTQQIDALFDDADRAADSSYTLLQQQAIENDLAYQQLLLQLQRLQQYKKIDSSEQKKAALLLQITQMDYNWLKKIPETDSQTILKIRTRYLEQRRQLVQQLHQEE